jgi:phosphoesterase RecJ-like protein
MSDGGIEKPMNAVREMASAFQEEVQRASCVLIGTHLNPDGDALGCALAFSLYLDGLGIENEVMCHHEAPRNLKFLPKVSEISQTAKRESYDLGVVLDLDSMDRLGKTEEFFSRCKRLIVIDHHVPHEQPGDIRIVDSSASAAAVILTRLFMEIGANITGPMATCLLTGIVTDTGSFRFRNTTPDSLAISAYLLEQGGDLNQISEEIFQNKTLTSAKLLGHVLDTMGLAENNQIAWSSLSNEDFVKTGAKDDDTEGFVNEMLFISTVKIAFLLQEPKAGKVRVSLRSRGAYDIAEVAREFGGGGHRNAAGCVLELPIPEVVDLLVRRLKLCLESS